MRQAIDCLRTVIDTPDWNSPADAELLGRFARKSDGAAFAALVRRHGPLVLGVCQRVLRDHHEAEDAFQAVFLILARKASAVMTPERLANWLYGVAYNTARKARAMTNRRRTREPFVADLHDPPEPMTEPAESSEELRSLLDTELARLPNDYRIAIILCDLEGRSQSDAASHLGWPQGTLSGRLFRAREMLAKRLIRHGFVVPASGFGIWLSQIAGAAHVLPPATLSLARMTTQWLATGAIPARLKALTNEAPTTMFLTKLSAAFTVLLGIVMACTAVFGRTDQPSEAERLRSGSVRFVGANPDDKKPAEKVDGEREALQKGWLLVAREQNGKRTEYPQGVGIIMGIGKDEIQLHSESINAFGGEGKTVYSSQMNYRVDPKKNPKTIDLLYLDPAAKPWMMGIYKIEKDRLIICWAKQDKDRPDDFTAKAKSDRVLTEYKQLKPEDVEP